MTLRAFVLKNVKRVFNCHYQAYLMLKAIVNCRLSFFT